MQCFVFVLAIMKVAVVSKFAIPALEKEREEHEDFKVNLVNSRPVWVTGDPYTSGYAESVSDF